MNKVNYTTECFVLVSAATLRVELFSQWTTSGASLGLASVVRMSGRLQRMANAVCVLSSTNMAACREKEDIPSVPRLRTQILVVLGLYLFYCFIYPVIYETVFIYLR